MMLMDFPRVRSSLICPLCGKHKEIGLLCCWHCYRARDMRNGNKEAEAVIAETNAKLMHDERLTSLRKE